MNQFVPDGSKTDCLLLIGISDTEMMTDGPSNTAAITCELSRTYDRRFRYIAPENY